MPVTALLSAAVLMWLAGAWLAGAAGSTPAVGPAHAPVVVPVAKTVPSVGADGSNDRNSAGGAPKSPAPSQQRGNSSSGSSEASAPKTSGASHPQATDSGGGGTGSGDEAGTPRARPASYHEPSAQGGAPTTAKPKTPGDPNTDPGSLQVHPAGLTRPPEPHDGTLAAPQTGQPRRSHGECSSGPGNCGAPPVPPAPAPAPVPSSASGGGLGSGGAGSGGGQPGAGPNELLVNMVPPGQQPQSQQPGGLVPKDKAPHSGLDPPPGTTAPFPNPVQKPGQPAAGAQPQQPCQNGAGCAPAAIPKPKPTDAAAVDSRASGGLTPEMKKELGHGVIDGVGMVPVLNVPANLANTVWYAADGDWGNAGWSLLGVIPGVSDVTNGARTAVRAAKLGKLAKDAYEAKQATQAAEVAKAAEASKKLTGKPAEPTPAEPGARPGGPNREPLTISANSNRRGPQGPDNNTPRTGAGRHNQSDGTAGSTPSRNSGGSHQRAPVTRRPDFVADENGTVVPTSRARLEGGLQRTGFPARPTRSPGTQYFLPDGTSIRIMEPSGPAPPRASFENARGQAISPFTGRPVQPPRGLSRLERVQHIRDRTHIELGP